MHMHGVIPRCSTKGTWVTTLPGRWLNEAGRWRDHRSTGLERHALEMLGRKHGRPLERTEGTGGSSYGDAVAGVGVEPQRHGGRESVLWSVRSLAPARHAQWGLGAVL